MMTINHERVYLPTETLGSWYGETGNLLCKAMELPWLENKRAISCIPEGTYRVTKEAPIPANDQKKRRERPYWHFRIHNVKGRSGILVHRITFVKDLKGCIGVGGRFVDLNKDGVPDIADSSKKLQWLVDNLPDEFMLHIKQKSQ